MAVVSKLKFIAPPDVDVAVRGTPFKITPVVSRSAGGHRRAKSNTCFLGLTKVGSLRKGGTIRFSKEEWCSVDEAHEAWWRGFTIDQEFSDANVIAAQLIEDGSAVAV